MKKKIQKKFTKDALTRNAPDKRLFLFARKSSMPGARQTKDKARSLSGLSRVRGAKEFDMIAFILRPQIHSQLNPREKIWSFLLPEIYRIYLAFDVSDF